MIPRYLAEEQTESLTSLNEFLIAELEAMEEDPPMDIDDSVDETNYDPYSGSYNLEYADFADNMEIDG
ncbi:MAG TPA: hypothetical protein P5539_05640 [Mesotoga sp.]|nr:hypothetical protein [Mesotoga sp.]